MMELFVRMNREFHKTVLLVTHDMEHVLRYCDDVVVVKDGSHLHTSERDRLFQRSFHLEGTADHTAGCHSSAGSTECARIFSGG